MHAHWEGAMVDGGWRMVDALQGGCPRSEPPGQVQTQAQLPCRRPATVRTGTTLTGNPATTSPYPAHVEHHVLPV